MRFRDDIDLRRTWLISDTHFGHKNIIGYCHRPDNFEDVLLENLSVVRPGDTLLHLGDLCYKGNAWFKNIIASKIAPGATKLLIKGNHDHQRYSFYKQCGWKLTHPFWLPIEFWEDGPRLRRSFENPEREEGLTDQAWMEACRTKVSFSHYPWSAGERGEKLPGESDEMGPWHHRIHGHIHNNGYFDGRSFSPPRWDLIPYLRNHVNLSCEMTKYKPVRLDLLLDAVLYGRTPVGEVPGDGDAPDASDIGKESHHA